MSAYPNPSCSECEEAIHVYCKKKNDEKFKLLEQAHCAKCWRPLFYNTNWPGSYESLRPPFHSPFQPLRLSVAQCGHIYHTQCIVESRSDNHCPSCFVWIQRWANFIIFFFIWKFQILQQDIFWLKVTSLKGQCKINFWYQLRLLTIP